KTEKVDGEQATLSGRVLGPGGRPASGAKLYVPRLKSDKLDLENVDESQIESLILNEQVGTADTGGNFRVRLPPARLTPRLYVYAVAPGLGVDWAELTPGGAVPASVILRLPNDVPITGRVLNTEGTPVRGVRVRALGVYAPPDDSLETFFTVWKAKGANEALRAVRKRLYGPLPGASSAVTDPAGRFTLRGFGADRLVPVGLSGAG